MKLRVPAGILVAAMLVMIWWPRLGLPGVGGPNHWKDGLHAPFFAIVTLLIFILTSHRWPIRKRTLFTLIIALCAAAVTEAVQPLFNRTASFGDLFANLIGITAAISGLWIHRIRKTGAGLKSLHALVSALCMLALFKPAIQHWHGRLWLDRELPELGNFDDPRAFRYWVSQGFAAVQSASAPADGVRVSTRKGFWSGISFYPGKQDWTGHTTITLEFENPGEVFALGLRIDDDGDCSQPGSRYSDSLILKPGNSSYRIQLNRIATGPKDRQLDLSAITRLALFLTPDDEPRVFFLKRAFLE